MTVVTTACPVIDAEAAAALKVCNRLRNRTDIETAVVATAGTAEDAETVAALKVGDVSRNGTVPVAETTGASTSKALQHRIHCKKLEQ